MAASKNTTELAAYLATVEVTPGNTAEMFRDMKDMISHLIDYVTESGLLMQLLLTNVMVKLLQKL